ncbi:MAG TPA: prephenate dehydratase [Lapillicoccus sp.]|jgi:prephenate dehydratase|uniref:prephenate dehydratase n=1 Tax=Lapillicoccus sp. TaxID=1909287 RepID=UPI002F949242
MTALRYGYLGPAGTFCQMALDAWTPAADAEHVPCDSVVGALEALRAGRLDAAMVPIENSVEGGVSATLDALSVGSDVVITGEVLVPVTFVLAGRPGTRLGDIRAVGTHPHGWAQVRTWMNANLPSAAYLTTLSTAAAAADLDLSAGDVAAYQAAVCAPGAATIHGLEVLAEDIGDNGRAVTRFALVARPGHTPPPTGADKTTLVLYQRDDHPGGLLELLEQFAARGVNMTRLESRPTGEAMGSYCFSIDIEGHVADKRVAETLMGLRRVCAQVRYLGSYARADGRPSTPMAGTSDAEFDDARRWLEGLRG